MRVPLGLRVLLLISAALVGGCATRRAGPSSAWDRQDARKQVYAAVLRQVFGGEHRERYVIDPVTSDTGAWGTERLARLSPTTRRDFLSQVAGRRMPEGIDAGLPIVWFSEADWLALPLPAGSGTGFLELEERWLAFHAAHPRSAGLSSFSDVGFSADGTQALLHVWTGTAGLSGYGLLVLLERSASGWTVIDKTETVIA